MTKLELYTILRNARLISDEALTGYLMSNPEVTMVDALVTLCGADMLPFDDNMRSVRRAYEGEGFIFAIKEYRRLFGTGLADSKEAVEKLSSENNWIRCGR